MNKEDKDKINKLAREFFDKSNANKMLDDFCECVRKYKIGDMSLNDYCLFRYWATIGEEPLKDLFEKFCTDMDIEKSDRDYTKFCLMMWGNMEGDTSYLKDDVSDDIKSMMDIGNIETMAKA